MNITSYSDYLLDRAEESLVQGVKQRNRMILREKLAVIKNQFFLDAIA